MPHKCVFFTKKNVSQCVGIREACGHVKECVEGYIQLGDAVTNKLNRTSQVRVWGPFLVNYVRMSVPCFLRV
jgi:hypothetical protein